MNRTRRMAAAAMTAALVAAAAPAIARPTVEVPIEFVRNVIVVKARVNGQGPFDMLLDTGADPSMVGIDMSVTLGLAMSKESFAGSGGGTDVNLARETSLAKVQIGDLVATDVAAVVLDLSKPSAAFGRPIAGVLGHSLLSGRIVQFDYAHRVVRFMTNSPFTPEQLGTDTPHRATLRVRYDNDLLIDGVKVGDRAVVANLDTGSDATVQVTPAGVGLLGLEQARERAHPSESTGFNGRARNSVGTLEGLSVGPLAVGRIPVVFFGPGTGHDDETWTLRLGNGVLKDFVVTIDYAAGLVTFERP